VRHDADDWQSKGLKNMQPRRQFIKDSSAVAGVAGLGLALGSCLFAQSGRASHFESVIRASRSRAAALDPNAPQTAVPPVLNT
jgi:hypothetical protein